MGDNQGSIAGTGQIYNGKLETRIGADKWGYLVTRDIAYL